ncbi:MAG: dihydroorotase [Omnitrophica bacterium]|nr:dihydroorotase [Candidatus Omnitrophota bacterium]
MKLLIKGGRIVDPANKRDEAGDILLEGARISKVAKNIRCAGAKIIDAKGKVVMPGLVDMHVHLRQPGLEDKETVATGTQAALKGGVTSVLAMPNTTPTIDCPESAELLKKIVQKSAKASVYICGAITEGRRGGKLTEISQLKAKGVIAISDDGASVDSDQLFLKAFKEAKRHKLLLICHSEDKALSRGGVVNLGFVSTRMGLRGISSESEYKRLQRDINLAQKAGAAVHIAHVSCKESVEIIRRAKEKGLQVTAETAPHYFALTEEEVVGFDTNMKMNPPLRSRADLEAVKKGLKCGIIDLIASDHAPHTENEKDIEFDRAAFGTIGLETELAVSITELVHMKILSWPELVRKLALNPAKILGIDKGTLGLGCDADLVIVSPEEEWIVNKEDIVSKSKNSAFLGKKLKGKVEYTICGGKIAYC